MFSVRTKVLASTAAGVLAVAVVSFAVLSRTHERNAEVAAFHSLRSVARFFASYERGDEDRLAAFMDRLLADEALRRAFVARDRDDLLRLAGPVFEELKKNSQITHWYFIAPDHTCFLRVHAPGLHGDRIERVTLSLAEKSGQLGAGKELGRTAFALRVVRPWRDAEGSVIGYMELGEEIDHFLVRMKEHSGDDFALTVKKKYLDEKAWADVTGPARNTWNDRPDVVVVDSTSFATGLVDFQGDLETIPDGGLFLEELEHQGRAYIRGAFPVRDAAGRKVGALFVLHDFTATHEAFQAGQTRGLFVVFGLGAALAALLAFALDRMVFARVRRVRELLAAAGGPRVRAAAIAHSDDLARLEHMAEELAATAPDEARRAP